MLSNKLWGVFSVTLCKYFVNCHRCNLHSGSKKYFVTTPIFYANAAPHIGHLQSCLYADALKRTYGLLGFDTLFSTGTDEYGIKIYKAAQAAKKEPVDFSTENSNKFKTVFEEVNISYSHFTRTTSKKHETAVQSFWNELYSRGYIYKGKYEGWYDVSEEAFVPSVQVTEVIDASGTKMVSCVTGNVLENVQEENYIFALSKLRNELSYWLSKDVIRPAIFADKLHQFVNEDLKDLSISRKRSRLSWGIQVPNDSSQTIYVWLDALVNYLTAAGYPEKKFVWPPDCHIIGKDILKFHGIYWPAFLIAVGLDPPRSIFCHSHWTVDYKKMSKSKENVVEPTSLVEKYGVDGFRYFLLKAAVPHSDANYSEVKIQRLLNAELADTLGNLLSRCTSLAINKHQNFPKFSKEVFNEFCGKSGLELIQSISALPEIALKHFLDANFYLGLEEIMKCLRSTNGFVQHHEPWELVKKKEIHEQKKLDVVLHTTLEVLRVCSLLLQPIIPTMSSSILKKLGVSENERSLNDVKGFPSYYGLPNACEGRLLGEEKIILYARKYSI